METKDLPGIIIAIIAIVGGLGIAVLSIISGYASKKEEKLALIETRNKERLALIEKGMDPLIADKENEKKSLYGPLLWGLLLTGAGFGLCLGYILFLITGLKLNFIANSLAVLFGGIGLIGYYIYRKERYNDKVE